MRSLLIALLFCTIHATAQNGYTVEVFVYDAEETNKGIFGVKVTVEEGCSLGTDNTGHVTIHCPKRRKAGDLHLDLVTSEKGMAVANLYESRSYDTPFTTGVIKIALSPKTIVVRAKIKDENGAIDNVGATIVKGNKTIKMDVDPNGDFQAEVKATMFPFDIEGSAPGYVPKSRNVQFKRPSCEITLERSAPKKPKLSRADSIKFARQDSINAAHDNELISKIFRDGCCSPHSFEYQLWLKQLQEKLFRHYQPGLFAENPMHPLQSHLRDIMTTLTGRLAKPDCEEEIIRTVEMLIWLRENSNARRIFGSFIELDNLLFSLLKADMQELRTQLAALLIEGFKKTYLLDQYKHLPVRPTLFHPARESYKNRLKVFEFVTAASTDSTFRSNLYLAQSELIRLGKVTFPLKAIRTANWQYKNHPEFLIVNYFGSRRKALKVLCANSFLHGKVMTQESAEFQNIAGRVKELRSKIDWYLDVLEPYTRDVVFDGYESYDRGVADYAKLLAQVSNGVFYKQNLNEPDAFRWKPAHKVPAEDN